MFRSASIYFLHSARSITTAHRRSARREQLRKLSERPLGFAAASLNSDKRGTSSRTFDFCPNRGATSWLTGSATQDTLSESSHPAMLLNGSSHHIAAAPVDYHSTFRLRAF